MKDFCRDCHARFGTSVGEETASAAIYRCGDDAAPDLFQSIIGIRPLSIPPASSCRVVSFFDKAAAIGRLLPIHGLILVFQRVVL